MSYKRQSIQPAHLTVQSISNNAFRCLDERRTSLHQEDSRRKAPKMSSSSMPFPFLFLPSQQL